MSESSRTAESPRTRSKLIARIVILLLVVIAAISVLYLKTLGPLVTSDVPVNSPSFAQKKPLPVFLDLGADTCVACKAMVPVLAELKNKYGDRLDVQFIDVWKNGEVAKQHDIGLIPTQIWFDADGIELRRHEGFISVEDVLAAWKDLGYDFATPPAGGD